MNSTCELGRHAARALKPYPDYKDSGVPWLGEVPKHWEVRRLKSWLDVNEFVLSEDTDPEYTFEYLDIGSVATGRLTAKPERIRFGNSPSRARRVVRPGDTIVSTVRTYLKAVWHAEHQGDDLVASTGFAVLTPRRGTFPRFVSYFCQSDPFTNRVTAEAVGIAYPAIAETRLGTFEVCIPPYPEQAAIVRFLDHAAYRPSGIEWLGEVPEHWEVRRVKSLSLVKRGASPRPIADPNYFDGYGEYAWVRIADVTASSRYLERTTQRLSVLGQSLSVPLEPGALFLSIAGSVGKPIITRIKCCIHDGFVYFPQFTGDVEFLCRIFASGAPFARLGKLGTQLNLNTDTVGNISLGWPPSKEQAAIVSFLDRTTAALDAATTSAQRETSLLREYHTRLIADVVTGKLDVREAAVGLPDEVKEPEPFDETSALIDGEEEPSDDLDAVPEEAAV